MAEIICNVCQLPIKDPAEQIDRLYVITANKMRPLPAQKKHDACAEVYERKRGLQRRYLKTGESKLPELVKTPPVRRTPQEKTADAAALEAVIAQQQAAAKLR